MKVTIVHDWLTGMRGGEKCLEVACEEFPDARLLVLLRKAGATSPVIERMDVATSFLQWLPAIDKYYRYCLPLMPRAAESLKVPEHSNLVLSFSHAVAKGVAVPEGVPHVCYCFTPMRYAWQLRSHYFAEQGSGPVSWLKRPVRSLRNRTLDRIQEWDRRVCDRVTHFVAISQTIASRIRKCYGRDSELIYPPVDTDFYTPADGRREDFYLVVSALTPYKRVDLAVDACRRLGRKLVIIGSGPMERRIRALADRRIQMLGWRENHEIRDYLRRCRALLFPGLEDFGIVPVEAQACGAPVVALASGGATETVLSAEGDHPGTGELFPEQTVDSLCAAMLRFERRLPQFRQSICRENAERFSRQRFRRELSSFLRRVGEQDPGPGPSLAASAPNLSRPGGSLWTPSEDLPRAA